MSASISVVIPARDAAATLADCLSGVASLSQTPLEVIVVDDGSSDDSPEIAARAGARVIRRESSGGPGAARNAGAAAARGEWLLFLDADVVAHPDLLDRFESLLGRSPEIDAAFGSYDDRPRASGLVSQFRNLLHHFTHQRASRAARTFWGGCGFVRKSVFLEHRGFDESYTAPSIEDIEFGLRISGRGHRIELDPAMQVCHLKRWTLRGMVTTDIFRRAWPWARLMLRNGQAPDDLNTKHSQRWSAVFAWGLVGSLAASAASPAFAILAPVFLSSILVLNAGFFRFLLRRRGLLFAAASVPLYFMYLLYSSATFGVAVLASPFDTVRASGVPESQP